MTQATPAEAQYRAALDALERGDVEAVVPACLQAVTLDPRHGPAWVLLARLAMELGQTESAVTALGRVPSASPPDVLCDAAALWGRLGRADQAERALRQVCAHPRAVGELAALLRAGGRGGEATALLSAAVHAGQLPAAALVENAQAVESAAAWAAAAGAFLRDAAVLNQWAAAAMREGDPAGAVAPLERALDVAPDHPVLLENLARACSMAGDAAAARGWADRAMAAGATATLRWLRARAVPIVATSRAELESERARYATELSALGDHLDLGSPAGRADALEAIQDAFHVHYMGEPLLELQRLHGGLVHRVVEAAVALPPRAPRPSGSGGRLRVGFASTFLCHHTVGRLFEGWIRGLDRCRFEVHAFHLGASEDARTRAMTAATAYRHLPGDVPSCAAAIAAAELDVLVYPELGMDARALRLGGLRLAPVQCAAWGHPVTTGLPTIDWFLSSELMEPPDGERHYTERLERLPHLSICVEPLDPGTPAEGRDALGLPPDGPVYALCQSLFKIPPEQDALIAAIASQVPDARLALLAHPSAHATATLTGRLARAFGDQGLDASRHVFVLPRLTWRRYLDLNLAADVFLDTLGWSGGQTTLEALACGLVPVTLPGETMRSRHTAAILRRAGVEDTIATGPGSYVELAVRLGRDPSWRAELRTRLAAGGPVWGDRECVKALERFLARVAGR